MATKKYGASRVLACTLLRDNELEQVLACTYPGESSGGACERKKNPTRMQGREY